MDIPSASSSPTAIADAEPTMIRRRTIQWPGEPAIKQHFSLPPSIMYYIAMNPSTPEGYKKLIQTCKYFFEANPIIVASTLTDKVICSNQDYLRESYEINDINKFKSKIWVTWLLYFHQNNIPNFTALLRPKIYRCDYVELHIIDGTVNFEDFKFFASSVKEITLHKTEIVNSNGCPVMLENVLEALPNVEKFSCEFANIVTMISSSTPKNISKLKNFGNVKKLYFFSIPEIFKLDYLFAFIKDQTVIKFWFTFAPDISEDYKNKLDRIIDSVIELKLSNCYISYHGKNREKNEILFDRFFD